ncbi:MAG: polymer-forming cytoskeletal protein [Pyrinomonadaceae bacterium]
MFRSNRNETPARGASDAAPKTTQTPNVQPPPTALTNATPVAPTPSSHVETQPARETFAPPEQARAQAGQGVEVGQGTPSRAVTDTQSLARGMKDGGVGGFVGGGSALTGEINFKGMMRVDGQLSGRVQSQDGTLIVSSGGRVEAEIVVAVAKINGTVEGDITATSRVELERTARVHGNIQTPALVIEEGAIFEGGCRMTTAAASPARAKQAA